MSVYTSSWLKRVVRFTVAHFKLCFVEYFNTSSNTGVEVCGNGFTVLIPVSHSHSHDTTLFLFLFFPTPLFPIPMPIPFRKYFSEIKKAKKMYSTLN